MDAGGELEALIAARAAEYEKRIAELEEAAKGKAQQILAMKGAVVRLSRVLDEFKRNKALNAVHAKGT